MMNIKTLSENKIPSLVNEIKPVQTKNWIKKTAMVLSFVAAPMLAHWVSHGTKDAKKNKPEIEMSAATEKTNDSFISGLVHGATSTEEFFSVLIIVFLYSVNEVRKGRHSLNGEKIVPDIMMEDPFNKGKEVLLLDNYLNNLKQIAMQEGGLTHLKNHLNSLSEQDKQFAVNRILALFIKEQGSGSIADLYKALEQVRNVSEKKIDSLKLTEEKRSEWNFALNVLATVGLVVGLYKILDAVFNKNSDGDVAGAASLAFLKLGAALPLDWLSRMISNTALKIGLREKDDLRALKFIEELILDYELRTKQAVEEKKLTAESKKFSKNKP